MKALFLSILLFCFSPSTEGDGKDERAILTKQESIAAASYLKHTEKAMVWEINLVRSDPQAYIPFVLEEMTRMRRDSIELSTIRSESITTRVEQIAGIAQVRVDTVYRNYYQDRMQALAELIIELDRAIPVQGLEPSLPLYTAAVKHGDSQSETGYISHRGRDGAWPFDRHVREHGGLQEGNENILRFKGSPREMVIQLLIDSGVPHRGHRRNILDPRWKYVTCHHVQQLDQGEVQWWIQEFAY
ncbi:MAG: hypothetical protein HKN79_03630 [Flavobacteriales bacterium]|nr:hypothetical protein [Flavobacteriales bacterium]